MCAVLKKGPFLYQHARGCPRECPAALTPPAAPGHPQHSNGNSHMALGDRRSERTTAGSALGCARGRQPRLGLAVRCGDLALSRKNMPFWTFFHVQPKHQNGAIFVNTEGFRPCLSKPSYRAPQWALMVRLMQKERLKSPQKSLFYRNQAFWVILVIFGQNMPFWSFWLAISEPGWDSPTKSPTWGLA